MPYLSAFILAAPGLLMDCWHLTRPLRREGHRESSVILVPLIFYAASCWVLSHKLSVALWVFVALAWLHVLCVTLPMMTKSKAEK